MENDSKGCCKSDNGILMWISNGDIFSTSLSMARIHIGFVEVPSISLLAIKYYNFSRCMKPVYIKNLEITL